MLEGGINCDLVFKDPPMWVGDHRHMGADDRVIRYSDEYSEKRQD